MGSDRRRIPSALRSGWAGLQPSSPPATQFDGAPGTGSSVADRWLTASIEVGTPLWTSIDLQKSGEIKIRAWRPFRSRQILTAGRGFIWSATASMGLPVVGYDRYVDGHAGMRWRLAGLIPVMRGNDADVVRSASGRLAIESVLVPTSYPTWLGAADAGRTDTELAISTASGIEQVTVTVDDGGMMTSTSTSRWGDPDGTGFAHRPFGIWVTRSQRLHGITVPAEVVAGWHFGTAREDEGQFFRARITAADFA